jgi:myosin heavy subunit
MVFEALDRATQEMKAIADGVEDVGESAEVAEKKGLSKFTGGMMDMKAGLDMAMTAGRAFVGVFKQTLELAKVAGQAERAEQAFTSLSGGTEQATANLAAMKTATRGAMSELEAMANANKLLAMGIVTNSEEMGTFAEMSTRLGQAMGLDAATAMENFALTIANKSLPRLDQMGISAGKVREEWTRLKNAGVEADEAFKLAVFAEGAEVMDRLGEAIDDTATSAEQAEAAFADLKAEVLEELAPALKNVTVGMTALITAHKRVSDAFKEQEVRVREAAGSYAEYKAEMDRIAPVMRTGTRAVEVLTEAQWEAERAARSHAAAIVDDRRQVYEQKAAIEELTVAMVAAAWAQEHGAETMEGMTEAHRRFAAAQEDDRRQSYLGTTAIERQMLAREAEAEAAEAQAAATEKAAEIGASALQKLAEARAEAAEKEAEARRELSAALGDEFDAALKAQEASEDLIEVDVAGELYAAADAAGASATTLALLAAATGDYNDETIAAALRTAALQEKIEEMGRAIAADPTLSIQDMIEEIKAFDAALDEVPDAKVMEIEVVVADIDAEMEAAADEVIWALAKHLPDDELTITPEADTSEADTALETTSGKVGTLTEAVGTATTDVEGLKEAMEEVPTELELTITSNLPHQIQLARQLESRDDYDDDPTSLH